MLKRLYKYARAPNRLALVLLPIAFIWMLHLIKIQLDLQRLHVDKDYLRERIVELSKEYVKAVARDKEANIIDGQSVVEMPNLKETTSVLLQNMLDRLMVLEKQVENVVSQSALDISELSEKVKSLNQSLRSFASNFTRGNRPCKVPNDPNYPECAAKVKWLKAHWKSHPKFSQHGVNGSICSFLHYLSEVETFCPSQKSHSINPNDCEFPEPSTGFPKCAEKIKWMISSWKTHPCYAQDFNVNGTICSFLIYLSEVESWCPRLPGRHSLSRVDPARVAQKVNSKGTSMEKLMDKLTNVVSASRLKWIRTRVVRMYSYWTKAMKEFQSRVNVTDKPMKKILIHIGVLAEEKTLHFAQTADKGGPLGELVQWCDIITSLYILGHDIQVTVEHSEVVSALGSGNVEAMKKPCPPKDGRYAVDMIFTDYYGLTYLRKKSAHLLQHYKCKLRIVDSFGTEAQFNYNGPLPAVGNPAAIGSNLFGKNDLNLKQYMTMFPHSPDNTFLGFVVNSKDNVPKSVTKKQQALTYGKHYFMWKDLKNRGFLDIIHNNFEVHATTGGLPLEQVKVYLPPYVINHGVVGPGQLHNLLLESKIFVGLGFPYEGPAPLEAIAQGCFFLNPKFRSAKNRQNTPFFKGKPTFRALTSQHPYAEEFIGEPRVLTVDIEDPVAVKGAIEKIIKSEPSPYLPFEFTHEGMLERANALLHNQDFCRSGMPSWPPLSSRTVINTSKGQSCKDACLKKNLVCEPAYFESINNAEFLEKASLPCKKDNTRIRSSLVAPAHIGDENICVLQAISRLYSCTAHQESVKRICPCRDYRKGQVALCKTCY